MKQGELFEADFFDEFNIQEDRSGKSKDHLVINWRRSILLTNSEFIAREDKKKEDKQLAEQAKLAKKRGTTNVVDKTNKKRKKKDVNTQVPYLAQLQVLPRVQV